MSATIVHHLITLCFAWALIGAVLWMVLFSSGRLDAMYAEPTGSGALIDAFAGVLITIVLILGWPGVLCVIAAFAAHQGSARQ